jgi:hypothetical protein
LLVVPLVDSGRRTAFSPATMASDMAQLVAGVRKAVAATRSMDQALRIKSEAQFKDMSLRNYPRLVYALGEIMRDRTTSQDDPDRQQASVLMQGIIKPRDPNMRAVYAKLWTDQSDSFKVPRLLFVGGLTSGWC